MTGAPARVGPIGYFIGPATHQGVAITTEKPHEAGLDGGTADAPQRMRDNRGNRWVWPFSLAWGQAATKKELNWFDVPGGRMKTTFFYGPWQCNQRFMTSCQRECDLQNRQLKGCIWLVDIKFDWQGRLFLPPVPVAAGSRYAISHCCCDYPTLSKTAKEVERKKWERIRDSFRESWSKKFGEWPVEGGISWPGHHIRDLWHGGDPVDPSNIIPVQPSIHDLFNKAYPTCYAGQAPWNMVGPDLPYTDN